MGYLDPGIFGMIAQLGYVLLFGLVSAVMFFFQPLKDLANRLLRRQPTSDPGVEPKDATDSAPREG